jgi:phosphohistidine phosphatase SixA
VAAGVWAALALAWGGPAAAASQEPALPDGRAGIGEPVVVVLVRHAEKADDDPRDPGLTAEGRARAELLSVMLADAGLTSVWSSDYRRTRSTAGPLAARLGLEVGLYDPSEGEARRMLVERLVSTPGRHLVVGHSNTIPGLVEALGGDAQGGIGDDEYDRLYLLTIAPDGSVTSTLLRFGSTSVGH